MYNKSVGRNATLILGLTPDNRGLLPEADVRPLKESGEEIKHRFEAPLATTAGSGNRLQLDFPKRKTVQQFVLQENIAKGHRVKNFLIQAYVKGRWKTVVEGSLIGNKFISVLSKPVVTRKLRLEITNAFAQPELSLFSAYELNNGL